MLMNSNVIMSNIKWNRIARLQALISLVAPPEVASLPHSATDVSDREFSLGRQRCAH